MSLARAVALFRGFHRRAPRQDEIVEIAMPAPTEALEIGEVVGISYALKGKRRAHWHRFRHRPKLLISSDGRQTFIVGNVRFSARGFLG
jgi:hypothetical protein